MNKLTVWLMVSVFLVCAVFAPRVAYAWDDPDPDDVLTCSCGFGDGGRWPAQVSGRISTKFDTPPQLSATQAYRWRIASPMSRVRLAKIYGIPVEVAKIFWANYKIP